MHFVNDKIRSSKERISIHNNQFNNLKLRQQQSGILTLNLYIFFFSWRQSSEEPKPTESFVAGWRCRGVWLAKRSSLNLKNS